MRSDLLFIRGKSYELYSTSNHRYARRIHYRKTQHIIGNINDIISAHKYDIIIATKFINYQESPFVKHLQWTEMIDKNTDLLPSIEAPSDSIIKKNGYQCGQELIDVLKENNIKDINIVGIDTDACVLVNAIYLFDNGFNVSVHSQACASTGGESIHKSAIEILKRNIGSQNVL